jgi:hypothetical protein
MLRHFLQCINISFYWSTSLPKPSRAFTRAQRSFVGIILIVKMLTFPLSKLFMHAGNLIILQLTGDVIIYIKASLFVQFVRIVRFVNFPIVVRIVIWFFSLSPYNVL